MLPNSSRKTRFPKGNGTLVKVMNQTTVTPFSVLHPTSTCKHHLFTKFETLDGAILKKPQKQVFSKYVGLRHFSNAYDHLKIALPPKKQSNFTAHTPPFGGWTPSGLRSIYMWPSLGGVIASILLYTLLVSSLFASQSHPFLPITTLLVELGEHEILLTQDETFGI